MLTNHVNREIEYTATKYFLAVAVCNLICFGSLKLKDGGRLIVSDSFFNHDC